MPGRTNPRHRESWTLLTNHAHVLICLLREPDILIKDVASRVGITQRAVLRIVGDLEHGGIISRQRVGRCNRYSINLSSPLRHPLENQFSIGELLTKVM